MKDVVDNKTSNLCYVRLLKAMRKRIHPKLIAMTVPYPNSSISIRDQLMLRGFAHRSENIRTQLSSPIPLRTNPPHESMAC